MPGPSRLASGSRKLSDLAGVGKVTLELLHRLGIRTVGQLSRQDPGRLYDRLGKHEQERLDPCVFKVLRCAVTPARDPELPAEQRRWYWSRVRKSQEVSSRPCSPTAQADPGNAPSQTVRGRK